MHPEPIHGPETARQRWPKAHVMDERQAAKVHDSSRGSARAGERALHVRAAEDVVGRAHAHVPTDRLPDQLALGRAEEAGRRADHVEREDETSEALSHLGTRLLRVRDETDKPYGDAGGLQETAESKQRGYQVVAAGWLLSYDFSTLYV